MSLTTPFDQALVQTALPAEPGLEAGHPAVIVLVIIAEQVQESVQRQHPQLGLKGMPGIARLPACDAGGDDDVTQVPTLFGRPASPKPIGRGREREDVGRRVLSAVLTVEQTHPTVRHDSHRDRPTRAGRRHSGQPDAKSGGPDTPACDNVNVEPLRRT